jgi:hypothetical protein
MSFGPCLCGDPGCPNCFGHREPGDNEVVLIELPGTEEVIQSRYGDLPDYGEGYEWIEEEPPTELEASAKEADPEGERLFFRLYSATQIGKPVKSFPQFILDEEERNSFPGPDAALLSEVFLVCTGFVEGHSVEGVFIDPKLAFEFAKKVAERESKFFKEEYVRSRDSNEKEIAVWSRRDGRFGGPNRLIGYVSIERHFIKRSEYGAPESAPKSEEDDG